MNKAGGRYFRRKFWVKSDFEGKGRNRKPYRARSGSYLEGTIVRWADRIAYINHDIDDALEPALLPPAIFG